MKNTTQLTPAQVAAVQLYVLEDAHEDERAHFSLVGRTLSWTCSTDDAYAMITDAANSADVGDNVTADRGSSTALSNVARKIIRGA